ncbi:Integrase catalytic domain-containing protein [Favolaschia claudopus]|uniref:Integrase catalytic domain-containing protein n=1 Tax=Favolaschia claudopus TaxID=2862362 RepID=A0AAW0C5M0_9AGAR
MAPRTEDPVREFLAQAQRIMGEARLVIEAIPNAEVTAAEHSLRQLYGVHIVLLNLQDPWLAPSEIDGLIDLVITTGLELETFVNTGPPAHNIGTNRALELHDMGNTWAAVADALGVRRQTLYNHLERADLSSARRLFTVISDEDLDENHIMSGHLESRNIHVPIRRVQESLWRVDAIGVLIRWHGVIKRRVYKVRGANALWHMDGNEKLRPLGFLRAIGGKENNGVERRMIVKWGRAARAYLRGRSTQNIRMERNWRDVRKDTLEFFREIFMHLVEINLLDMENSIHRVCLFVVFQPRIQKSLGRNDCVRQLQDYGHDPQAPLPPMDELQTDPTAADFSEYPDVAAERDAGIVINDDDEVQEVQGDFGGAGTFFRMMGTGE